MSVCVYLFVGSVPICEETSFEGITFIVIGARVNECTLSGKAKKKEQTEKTVRESSEFEKKMLLC